MPGRILTGISLAAIVSGMLAVTPLSAEANPFCLVENLTTSAQGADLQQAINDANNGDTITVKGVCFGNFIVDRKTLTFRGVSTPARKYPTLDGSSTGRVLTVEGQADLTIKNLTITHGNAAFGGGFFISSSTVTLNGSTRVVHNTTNVDLDTGGGVCVNGGSLTMNGSSRVNQNTSAQGGGVLIENSGTMIMNDHSRVNQNDASDIGGGVYNYDGTLTMNDASTVAGNTASFTGGGIFNGVGGTESGATAGGNVRNNTPDDIAP